MKCVWVVAAVVFVVACSTVSGTPASSPLPSSSLSPVAGPSPVARQLLPPAKSLPIVALCSQQLTTDQNGVAGPLICSDGALNVLAWNRLATVTPRVLAGGQTATVQGVQAALCRDVNLSHAAVLDELSAYDLAASYYGWRFSTDPTDILYSMSKCPR